MAKSGPSGGRRNSPAMRARSGCETACGLRCRIRSSFTTRNSMVSEPGAPEAAAAAAPEAAAAGLRLWRRRRRTSEVDGDSGLDRKGKKEKKKSGETASDVHWRI